MPKMPHPTCRCAEQFQVHQATSGEYKRVKSILNQARHPTFIGPDQIRQSIVNGGVTIFAYKGVDVAVGVLNPKYNVLTVLSVIAAHQGHGLGTACLRYLQANFARVIESAVPFFERNGYTAIGALKQGRTLRTQIMVRKDVLTLAGRIARIYSTV